MSLVLKMESKVDKALRQYERRLEQARKWSSKYYQSNAQVVKTKRLIQGIARGITPTKASVEKFDRELIVYAWIEYVATQTELSNRAKAFHRYIMGEEWVPVCECV